MELKYLDANNVKSLEDYLLVLCIGIISIDTMASYHEQVINLGILKEDQISRANTMLWDLKRRLIKLYFDQAESVAELLPEGFTIETTIAKLKEKEILAAKKLTRKPKTKE